MHSFILLFEQSLYCVIEEILIRSLYAFKMMKDLPNIYKDVRSHMEEVVSGDCKFQSLHTIDL